jgi:hypothetical protein
MQTRTLRSFVLLSTVAVLVAGTSSLAHAQVGPMDPSSVMQRRAASTPDLTKHEAPLPPALPGATSHPAANRHVAGRRIVRCDQSRRHRRRP